MGKTGQNPVGFKKEVIAYMEEKNCNPHQAYLDFSRKVFDDDESLYYHWWKTKDTLKQEQVSKKQFSGAGCPTMLGTLEDLIYNKIVEMRIKKMVTGTLIHRQATILTKENNIEGFVASLTWVTGFMKRFMDKNLWKLGKIVSQMK